MLELDSKKNRSEVSMKMKSVKIVHAHKKGAPSPPKANSVNKTNPMTNQ